MRCRTYSKPYQVETINMCISRPLNQYRPTALHIDMATMLCSIVGLKKNPCMAFECKVSLFCPRQTIFKAQHDVTNGKALSNVLIPNKLKKPPYDVRQILCVQKLKCSIHKVHCKKGKLVTISFVQYPCHVAHSRFLSGQCCVVMLNNTADHITGR